MSNYKNPWLELAEKPNLPMEPTVCLADRWYDVQFVQNEKPEQNKEGICSVYTLERTPIIGNTVTFVIYAEPLSNMPVQTGFCDDNGKMTFENKFKKIGTPLVFAEAGNINLATGEITLRFNKEPGENFLVVSYEYKTFIEPKPLIKHN